jgi:prefoldin subunit 5
MDAEEKKMYASEPPLRGLWAAVVALICLVVISLGYAIAQHNSVGRLSAENQQANTQLTQTESEIQALTEKMNALQAQSAAKRPAEAPHRVAVVRHRPVRFYRPRPVESPLKKIEAELAEHQKEIKSTQQNLEQTRTELQSNLSSTADQLNGAIAKNHTELVALEKLGQRSYYEFDIGKSKLFQREGPIGLKLRKANVKHQFADLELIVDDRDLTQKHVNLYQPVLFYPAGSRRPVQLVINGIFKNEIHGYVSAPKYKASELAAGNPASEPAAGQAANAAAGNTSGSANLSSNQTQTPVALEHRPGMQN